MAYFFQITNDWNQALISMIGNLIQGSWRPNKVVQLARCSLNVFACVFVFVFLSLSSNDTVNADIYNAATMMAVVIDFPGTCETCDMLPLPYIWRQRSQLWKLYLLMLFFIVNHIETEKRDHLYSRSHIGCYGQLMRMSCLSHNGCNILHGEMHKIVLCLKPLYSYLHQQYLKWNKRFSFLCIFYQIMNQSRRRGNLYKTNTGYMYLGAKSKRMGLIYVWRAGLTNEGLIIPLLRRQKVLTKPTCFL